MAGTSVEWLKTKSTPQEEPTKGTRPFYHYCVLFGSPTLSRLDHRPSAAPRGCAPALSDEEVSTLEICGECWKLHTEEDLYEDFRTHHLHLFPKLKDRPAFVRQAFNLWAIKAPPQQRLVPVSGRGQRVY